MPFEELTVKVAAKADTKPVTIRLNSTIGKPTCVISIRKMIAQDLKFESGNSIGVAFGTGDDYGKMRLMIREAQAGLVPMHILKTGSFSVHIGFIERFGLVPKEPVGCDARVIDDKTIEITLPIWADVPDLGEESTNSSEATDEGEEEPEPKQPTNPTGSNQHNKAGDEDNAPTTPLGVISRNGVDITVNPPSIQHDGDSLPLAPTQQRIMAILLPSLDMGPIPGSIIAKKMGASEEDVRFALAGLQPKLGKVNLAVELIKGIGYVIKKI